jgi:hypothetical protein
MSRVSFASITLCVASQRVFIVVSVYFVIYTVRKLLDTPTYNSALSQFSFTFWNRRNSVVKLSLCLTKYDAMKTYGSVAVTTARILNLGSRRRWVVRFTPRPLYPGRRSPRYPLDKEAGWAPEPVWVRWWREESLPARSLVSVLSYLCFLSNLLE